MIGNRRNVATAGLIFDSLTSGELHWDSKISIEKLFYPLLDHMTTTAGREHDETVKHSRCLKLQTGQ